MITDSWVRYGISNLLRAHVRRDNAVKIFHQSARRLTATGGTVPGQVMILHCPGEKFKQRLGIFRPEFGVIPGVGRKVILELHILTLQAGFFPLRPGLRACRKVPARHRRHGGFPVPVRGRGYRHGAPR